MPEYKLVYFDARGRAELARYLFALAGAKYEDKRLKGEDWGAFKPKTTCGQIPVLYVDGKQFSQSMAIIMYLARQFGFYGRTLTDLENFAIDEIVCIAGEVRDLAIQLKYEKIEEKKAELVKKRTEKMPQYLGILEKLLKAGDNFFVAKKLTLADLVIFDLLSNLLELEPALLDKSPKLEANYNETAKNPKIKAWIAKRPPSAF